MRELMPDFFKAAVLDHVFSCCTLKISQIIYDDDITLSSKFDWVIDLWQHPELASELQFDLIGIRDQGGIGIANFNAGKPQLGFFIVQKQPPGVFFKKRCS